MSSRAIYGCAATSLSAAETSFFREAQPWGFILWDVKYRASDHRRYQLAGRAAPFPLPQQLGREAAGEVIAVRGTVTPFKPGDRVIGVTHPESEAAEAEIRREYTTASIGVGVARRALRYVSQVSYRQRSPHGARRFAVPGLEQRI